MAVAAAHVAQPAEVQLEHLQSFMTLQLSVKALCGRQVGLQQHSLLLGA